MLKFTYDNNEYQQEPKQLQFQPIIIEKNDNSNRLLGIPKKNQKKIIPTSNLVKRQQADKKVSKDRKSLIQNRNNWIDGGKVSIFDKSLKKNQLAAEERRLKVQEKKIIQKNINKNKDKNDDKEIKKLKQMIKYEKKQKQKQDYIYQLKKKKIQKQRQQLEQLQRKIQKQGIKVQKQIRVQLQKKRQPIISYDRGKCHQDPRIIGSSNKYEITQSQLANKHQIREKQIAYLSSQRQKCINKLPTNIHHTSSIIPLISRASYKIISTHISTLVELFIDDIIEEQIIIMEQIQVHQQKVRMKNKNKLALEDYCNKLEQFVDQTNQIGSKVGRYHTMKFEDLYIPKNYPQKQIPINAKKQLLSYNYLQLTINEDIIDEITNRKDRFERFVNNFDEYQSNNMNMFTKCTEELINEAIQKVSKEFDNGCTDFINDVFHNQFN